MTLFKLVASSAVIGSTLWIASTNLIPPFGLSTENHDDVIENDISQGKQPATGIGLQLDFAVVGFPKCGTSFLLKVLGQHPEVAMPKEESCHIQEKEGDNQMKAFLQDTALSSVSWLSKNSSTHQPPKKYGIKCPSMVRDTRAINNLAHMSQNTRLVVGVRHPVLWFQSFYNYRVSEHYNENRTQFGETIMQPSELTDGTKQWRSVATACARFEIYLMQLAKVPLDPEELKHMMNAEKFWLKQISPNPFKLFIYDINQLNHGNVSQFGIDLQHFLRLQTPFPNFKSIPKANDQSKNKSQPPPEHIDICDPQFRGIRSHLLQHGEKTSKWISERFIESNDVIVSDKEYFISMLSSWGDDPCV